jgi:hypothetical protein
VGSGGFSDNEKYIRLRRWHIPSLECQHFL